MKEKLYELIQKQQETLFAMADQIHDDPEYDRSITPLRCWRTIWSSTDFR